MPHSPAFETYCFRFRPATKGKMALHLALVTPQGPTRGSGRGASRLVVVVGRLVVVVVCWLVVVEVGIIRWVLF